MRVPIHLNNLWYVERGHLIYKKGRFEKNRPFYTFAGSFACR